MDNKIATVWIQNLSAEDKDGFIGMLKNNYNDPILLRLKAIIETKRQALEASERNPSNYDDASWSHKQAHNNGARQMLKYVEDLLSFTK